MDIITTPSYEEMQKLYKDNFSLYYLGNDISNKFALISLTCYLVFKLKSKKPDITHWSVLYKIGNGICPEDLLKKIAVICSDFGYGCVNFPTFGLKDTEIPKKIKEILEMSLPF